jgi:phosphatidylserine/phosphatidylglycerophosphate/cardiolipin synthase-like enzyme
MGDTERDFFWMGTALQSLVTLGSTQDVVKMRNGISEILGELIATYLRNQISGNLLTEAQKWATNFRDNYAENERLRQADLSFVTDCQNWIKTLMDMMKERYAQPKELYDRLPKIDIIHDAIIQIQTAESQFVCTSPNTRTIKDKASEAIDNSVQGDEILMTGYFDNALVDRLIRALHRGVQVRLIVPRYRDNERDNIAATRRLRVANGQVKQHDSSHARIMTFGTKSALVSSADPKTDGLDLHFEAGIWTSNRSLVQNCKDFFEVIWEESVDWNM